MEHRRVGSFMFTVSPEVAADIDSLEAGKMCVHKMIDEYFEKKEREIIDECFKQSGSAW